MALSVGELLGYISIKGLSEAVSGLSAVRGGFTESGAAAGRMAAEVDRSEAALTGAGRASTVASRGSAQFRANQLSALAATERYNKVLADEDASLGRLATAEASVIRANERVRASSPEASITRTNAAAKETPGLMARTSHGLLDAAKSAVGLGVAFGAFETVKKVVDFGSELTTSLNSVQAASKATDEQMVAVRAECIAIGKDMKIPGATAIDAANGIDDLVRAGVRLPRALAAVRPALLLATAAQSNMALSSRVLGDALDEYHLPASQAGHVADILAAASTHAAGGLETVFDAMRLVAPQAHILKIPMVDLYGSIDDLAKSGLQASTIGSGLAMVFQRLTARSPETQAALKDLGIDAWDAQGRFRGLGPLVEQLSAAQQRFGPNSKKFLGDIDQAFGARASKIITSFASRGVEGFEQMVAVMRAGNVQKAAEDMNRGVAAEFTQIRKQFTAAGIDIYDGAEPGLAKVLQLVGEGIPAAVHLGTDVLHPFVAGWHAAGAVLGPVGSMIGALIGDLHPLMPVLQFVAKDVLLTWAAFKGYQIARTAAYAVADGVSIMSGKATAGLANMRTFGTGMANTFRGIGTEADVAAKQLQADALQVGADAQEEAAAVDRAAAQQAEAYAEMVAASDDASASMISDSQNAALAAQQQADASTAAAAEIRAAADAAAADVEAAGSAATVGWSEMLGPLAAVGIGLGLLTTLFHHSSSAEHDATAASQGYAQSLQQSANALAAVNTNETIKNLKANDSLKLLSQLRTGNNQVAVSQGQLVLAVNQGGKAYTDVIAKLRAYADANEVVTKHQEQMVNSYGVVGTAGTEVSISYNKQGQAAIDLIGKLRSLRSTFTAQQKAQQQVEAAQRSLIVQQNGGTSAVARMARGLGMNAQAYITAKQAAQQNTLQTRTQTEAFQAENDAASLLQQALDGLAGINLSVATAQTSLASANLSVRSSFKQNGDAIRGNSQASVNNQQAIQQQVQAAQQYAEAIGKKTKSTIAETAALHTSKTQLEDQLKAQGKLTPAVQAYINKLYALNKIHLKPTQVDIDKSAADAKIAQFQTEIDSVKQGKIPGLTADSTTGQRVIAALEQDITDIRQGRAPSISVDTSSAAAALYSLEHQMHVIAQGATGTVTIVSHSPSGTTSHKAAYADGGLFRGRGGPRSDSNFVRVSNGEFIVNAAATAVNLGLLHAINSGRPVQAYADGGHVGGRRTLSDGITVTHVGGKREYRYDDQNYESLAAAQNAAARAAKSMAKESREAAHEAAKAWRELATGAGERYRIRNGKLTGKIETPGDLLSGLHDVEHDLRQVGVPKAVIVALSNDNAHLIQLAKARNAAANQLAKANAALVNAQKMKAADIASFKAAVVGSFDITTAGQGANGRVTSGSLMAAQQQAVTRAKAFVRGLSRLSAMHVFPAAYLRQLAGEGPNALAEIDALLAMPKGEMAKFAANEKELESIGGREARRTAGRLDDQRIKEDREREKRAAERLGKAQHRLEVQLKGFEHKVDKRLEHLHMHIDWKTGDLKRAYDTDSRRSGHRGKTSHG